MLLFPPGWSLNIGGPHIALPLLKGFLKERSITAEIRDLNIELSQYFKVNITQSDVIKACESPTLASLNKPYFISQDRYSEIASTFQGKWEVHEGFRPDGFNPSSSESIRHYSQQISPYTEFFSDEVIPSILNQPPSMIGVSISVPDQLLSTFEFCRMLRGAGYEGRIFLGGNMIARIWENMLKNWIFELVDGLVVYQGEQTLVDLSRALEKGHDLGKVPNLIWKQGDQFITNDRYNAPANTFEGPCFDGLSPNDYWGVSYLPMIGSRGCYYGKCSFCAIPFGWGDQRFTGHDKPGRVFQYMRHASEKYNINRFKFVEEAMHPAILRRLCDIIIEHRFSCHFEGYARFDPFLNDTEFLTKVSKAGLRKVYLGLELSPGDTRALLNKSDTAPAVETLKRLYDAGIKTHIFCMFGYPGTGVDEALNTIEFVLKYEHLIDTLDIFPFYYAKHTHVDLVEPIIDPEQDWAVEYAYLPSEQGVLSHSEVNELALQLEGVIWEKHPEWLHPTYRMYSPWQMSIAV